MRSRNPDALGADGVSDSEVDAINTGKTDNQWSFPKVFKHQKLGGKCAGLS